MTDKPMSAEEFAQVVWKQATWIAHPLPELYHLIEARDQAIRAAERRKALAEYGRDAELRRLGMPYPDSN